MFDKEKAKGTDQALLIPVLHWAVGVQVVCVTFYFWTFLVC